MSKLLLPQIVHCIFPENPPLKDPTFLRGERVTLPFGSDQLLSHGRLLFSPWAKAKTPKTPTLPWGERVTLPFGSDQLLSHGRLLFSPWAKAKVPNTPRCSNIFLINKYWLPNCLSAIICYVQTTCNSPTFLHVLLCSMLRARNKYKERNRHKNLLSLHSSNYIYLKSPVPFLGIRCAFSVAGFSFTGNDEFHARPSTRSLFFYLSLLNAGKRGAWSHAEKRWRQRGVNSESHP